MCYVSRQGQPGGHTRLRAYRERKESPVESTAEGEPTMRTHSAMQRHFLAFALMDGEPSVGLKFHCATREECEGFQMLAFGGCCETCELADTECPFGRRDSACADSAYPTVEPVPSSDPVPQLVAWAIAPACWTITSFT